MPFRDRSEAGKFLAQRVLELALTDCLVFALPRGGVPVAVEVAKVLTCPLDILMVRKLRAPFDPEVAIGSVVDGDHPEILVNEDLRELVPTRECIEAAAALELQEIRRRRMVYLQGHHSQKVAGKDVVIVDDGIATGSTIRGAISALRRQQAKQVTIAIPVAPTAVIDALRSEVDAVVCLETHEPFGAVGDYYHDFRQVTDQDVVVCLAQYRNWFAKQPSSSTG